MKNVMLKPPITPCATDAFPGLRPPAALHNMAFSDGTFVQAKVLHKNGFFWNFFGRKALLTPREGRGRSSAMFAL